MPIACVGVPSVPKTMPVVRSFNDGNGAIIEIPYFIAGVTRDSTGAVLGGCSIVLFRTADNSIAAQNFISDPVTGAYSVVASTVLQHYAVAYKPGAPDVSGTTKNNLVAS